MLLSKNGKYGGFMDYSFHIMMWLVLIIVIFYVSYISGHKSLAVLSVSITLIGLLIVIIHGVIDYNTHTDLKEQYYAVAVVDKRIDSHLRGGYRTAHRVTDYILDVSNPVEVGGELIAIRVTEDVWRSTDVGDNTRLYVTTEAGRVVGAALMGNKGKVGRLWN